MKANSIENYEKKAEQLLKLNEELDNKNQKLKEEMVKHLIQFIIKERVRAEQQNICNKPLDSEEQEEMEEEDEQQQFDDDSQKEYDSNQQNNDFNEKEQTEEEMIQQITKNVNLEEQLKNQQININEQEQISLEETVRTLQECIEEQQKIMKIQSLKQTALTNEVEDLTAEIEKDEIIISEIDTEGKHISQKAKSHQQQIISLNEKLEKIKKNTEDYKKQLVVKEKSNKDIQIELEKLSKESKKTEQEMNKKDLKLSLFQKQKYISRINRLQEELDKQKLELQKYKQQHHGKFEDFESLNSKLQQENQKLERYKVELLTTFKKQLKYIDILKRQKTHLQAAYLFQYSEKEFLKALELGEKVNL